MKTVESFREIKKLPKNYFTISYGISTLMTPKYKELERHLPKAAAEDVLQEKVFLEISQNSLKNSCVRVSFLMKLQALRLQP